MTTKGERLWDSLSAEQRDRAFKEWGELLKCANASEKFEGMADKEIANFLTNHIWAWVGMTDVRGELISSAIDRLERANGGPLTGDKTVSLPIVSERSRAAARSLLAAEVYQTFVDGTSTFEELGLGASIAYLLGAILKDDRVEFWGGNGYYEAVLRLMDELFPKSHEVWQYVIRKEGP